MALKVEIDAGSGFCGGVIRAIGSAEKFLDEIPGRHLFSLGAIVHNEEELARLGRKGLVTIDYDDLADMQDAGGESLLIRAHGEPPGTYARAAALGDSIRSAYARLKPLGGQVVLFGKIGHAEVLGLVGQVNGDAVVVENRAMLESALAEGTIRTDVPVEIFSQTTKSPAEYSEICEVLSERLPEGMLTVHNTVCSQVATRHDRLSSFALSHDVILFVSGKSSSNGKVLCDLCKSLNIRTYHIGSEAEIKGEWFGENDRVGVCGATSTPKWLLEKVAACVEAL